MKYSLLSEKEKENSYGGADLGMGIVCAFGVIAIITVVVFKIFESKKGDITLPGGFKFKFTT